MQDADPNRCACGEPLHYTNPVNRHRVESFIAEHGWCVKVVIGGRAWMVPRHYIALHGLKADDIEMLAARFQFEEVKP